MDCPLFLSNTKRKKKKKKQQKKSLKSCHPRRHLRNKISSVFLFNGQLLMSSLFLFCSIYIFYHFFFSCLWEKVQYFCCSVLFVGSFYFRIWHLIFLGKKGYYFSVLYKPSLLLQRQLQSFGNVLCQKLFNHTMGLLWSNDGLLFLTHSHESAGQHSPPGGTAWQSCGHIHS